MTFTFTRTRIEAAAFFAALLNAFVGQTTAAAFFAAAWLVMFAGRFSSRRRRNPERPAMLKIYDHPTFTRTVYIEQPSRERLDGVDRDPIKVTYRMLEADELTQLGEVQKKMQEEEPGGTNALAALAASLDTIVEKIEGFGDANAAPIEGSAALDVAKRRWNIGRQINDAYWTSMQTKDRAKNSGR